MTQSLNLGCGQRKSPGSIGVDINPSSNADVLVDLNRLPYPFDDNCFVEIICEHVLEHLDDVITAIEEIHRIAKPGALLIVEVPHFSSVHFYQDPTHKHAFTSRTFDYFVKGTAVNRFGYSKVNLHPVKIEFPPPISAGLFKRVFFRLVNHNIDFYEKHLAFILPRHLLRFELKVIK